ncbi:MAG: hypothetical protein F6K42_00585 [Leptolyngbya sp. SIO1D8]|nr:hypothetical protein [Leptolyngbya sp. SIO1D8]
MRISFDRKINIPEVAWILNVEDEKIAFKRLEIAAYAPYSEAAFCLWGQATKGNIFYPILSITALLVGSNDHIESRIYDWIKDWEIDRVTVAEIPGIAEASGESFHPVIQKLKKHPTIESKVSIKVLSFKVSEGIARYHQFRNSEKFFSKAYAPMGRILESLRRLKASDDLDVEAGALLFALSQARPQASRPAQLGTRYIPGICGP